MGKVNELYHHGIVGMKWGVRRYQNEDGSLTAAGKARYQTGETKKPEKDAKSKYDGLFDQTIKGGKDRPNISPAEKVGKESERIVDGLDRGINAIDRIRRRNQKPDESVQKMSDEELRQRINRLNLEKQYNDLSAKDTSRGMETVKDVLAIAGSTVAVVGGAVTIYATLKKLG